MDGSFTSIQFEVYKYKYPNWPYFPWRMNKTQVSILSKYGSFSAFDMDILIPSATHNFTSAVPLDAD